MQDAMSKRKHFGAGAGKSGLRPLEAVEKSFQRNVNRGGQLNGNLWNGMAREIRRGQGPKKALEIPGPSRRCMNHNIKLHMIPFCIAKSVLYVSPGRGQQRYSPNKAAASSCDIHDSRDCALSGSTIRAARDISDI